MSLSFASHNSRIHASLVEHGLEDNQGMSHVFDLDNTLLMTKPLVERAYREAGADMEKFRQNWGNPRGWTTPEIADKKREIYARLLQATPPTKTILYAWASQLNSFDPTAKISVLTSASFVSCVMIKDSGVNLPNEISAGYSLASKIELLSKIPAGLFVYYDDDMHNISVMRQVFHNQRHEGCFCHMVDGALTFYDIDNERGETSWTVSY